MGEFVSALGNPWMPAEFNVTRQGQFLLRYGAARAEQFRKLAEDASASAPRPDVKVFILNKRIGGSTGADGSSGGGPPA